MSRMNSGLFRITSPEQGYGRFTIADLPSSVNISDPTAVLTTAANNTLSGAISIGAKTLQLFITTSTANATFKLELYWAKDSYAAKIYSTGTLTANNETYIGNNEGVDLGGYDFKIKVVSLSAGTITVTARACS